MPVNNVVYFRTATRPRRFFIFEKMETKFTIHTKHVSNRPWEFLLLFLFIFFVIALILHIIDFVPEPKTDAENLSQTAPTVVVDVNAVASTKFAEEPTFVPIAAAAPVSPSRPEVQPVASATPSGSAEAPVRIEVMKVGVDTPVLNPASADIATLDEELLRGAVRHPQTSFLNENGDVLIFGHQSYLPVVKNKAFKAFNDLQELETGDQIIVYSATAKYYYKVSSIELAKASDGKVELAVGRPGLTLVTCNSLGAKEDRYVIKAEFVSKAAL